MDWLAGLLDFVLHIDTHLVEIVRDYGAWTYAILFAIVFLETGVVITPFLPGDSLLFAAGTIAAASGYAVAEAAASAGSGNPLNVHVLFALLALAAILGDSLNYAIGFRVGPRVFTQRVRFLKREYLERTRLFYEKHGGKTIFLARFMPIIRTFAPFVAGIGRMSYSRYIGFNVAGGVVWVALFLYAGYFFGNLPWVRKNFTAVILAIIVLSILPMVVEWVRHRRAR